jgi:hypothetical protein
MADLSNLGVGHFYSPSLEYPAACCRDKGKVKSCCIQNRIIILCMKK